MKKQWLFPVILAVWSLQAAPPKYSPAGNRQTFRDERGRISGTAIRFGEQVIVRDANGNIGGRVIRFGDKDTFVNADGKTLGTVSAEGDKVVTKDPAGMVTDIQRRMQNEKSPPAGKQEK